MTIGIVDYGMGNLRSVLKALEYVEASARIIATPQEVEACDRLILPGVGAFKDAIAQLRKHHLDAPIVRHIESNRPFLGICLGLQLLFDYSQEDGRHAGLGVLGGRCIRFDVDQAFGLKVPHMGWNQLSVVHASPLTEGTPPDGSVYFVHSYHVEPADPSIIATTTDYGRPFVSSIRRGNIMAVQFHPEKSQAVGLRMLGNFARL